MTTSTGIGSRAKRNLLTSHPVAAYFALTFAISWAGAFLLVAPRVLRGQTVPKFTGLMMFPVMLLGPSISGLLMTALVRGRDGLRDLLRRLLRWRVPPLWFLPLLVPPILVIAVLEIFRTFFSPTFRPNHFFAGMGFGLVAGFLEEIGWSGFAFPEMTRVRSAIAASITLGLIWSAWHIPVIDYLGAASPHGSYWLPFFLSFAAAMTAIRVLISWLYLKTDSVLLAQLMHASSTGALVVLSPPVTAAQEVTWYASYALVLWVVVAVLVIRGDTLH